MKEIVCIVCPKGCRLKVDEENGYTVTGNECPRGEAYGKSEAQNPVRTITSTVKITGACLPRCPVKTDAPIKKAHIAAAMKTLDTIVLKAPVHEGDIIVPSVLGEKANFVVTRDMQRENGKQA